MTFVEQMKHEPVVEILTWTPIMDWLYDQAPGRMSMRSQSACDGY